MITELNVIDGTETFKTVTADTYTLNGGRRVWTRTYSGGSTDVVIVNTAKTNYTYNGITTDAYLLVWNSTLGQARLFDCTSPVTVTGHTVTYQSGGQCDISL
jgi:hypothetical protein